MASRLEAEKEKAYEKAKQRNRKRATRKAVQQSQARKRQIVIRYTEDGQRIGDDGFIMTTARLRLHHLYNPFFFLMCASFVGAAICLISSYFQNQTITDLEFIWVGGNLFNGYSVGTLLRIEALYLLYLTVLFLFSNQKGMAWMYDNKPMKPVRTLALLMIIPSAVYFLVSLVFVDIPEPVSLVAIVLGVLNVRFVADVDRERGSLKKGEVARVVVKH